MKLSNFDASMKKFKLSDVEFRRLLLSIVTNDLLIDANLFFFFKF